MAKKIANFSGISGTVLVKKGSKSGSLVPTLTDQQRTETATVRRDEFAELCDWMAFENAIVGENCVFSLKQLDKDTVRLTLDRGPVRVDMTNGTLQQLLASVRT